VLQRVLDAGTFYLFEFEHKVLLSPPAAKLDNIDSSAVVTAAASVVNGAVYEP